MDAGKPAKCKIRQGEALYDGGGSLLEALLEEKGIQDDERVDKVAKVGDAEKSEVEVFIKIKQNLCSSRDFLSMSCFANFLHTGSSLGPKE